MNRSLRYVVLMPRPFPRTRASILQRMMSETFARQILAIGLVAVLLVVAPRRSLAETHLDPPGPPAFIEVIWLFAASVLDDLDWFAAGELFLSYTITQPGHPVVTGVVPVTGVNSLNAPPLAAFPGLPVVIYNHFNCQPLERPFTFTFVLNDNDVFGIDKSSPLILSVGGGPGAYAVGGAQFSATVLIGILPAPPAISALCAAGAPPPVQPPPPAAPATPNLGPFFDSPELPPVPEPQRPKLVVPKQVAVAVDEEAQKVPSSFLSRTETALYAGIVIGLAAGLVVGLVLAWSRRRRRTESA